jgi:hypothetical protein
MRAAISLTEVLIAMGILTVGLLDVASIFPVGGWYMQKAENADRGAAIAKSVMSDLVARGMLNPQSWFMEVPNAAVGTGTSPNYYFTGIDGKYAPVPQPANKNVTAATFTRPFAESLSQGLNQTNDPVVLAKQFGSAYVVDPLFAAAASSTVSSSNNIAAYPFPAAAYGRFPWPSSTYYGTAGWDPWRASTSGTNAKNGDKTWPIRRVTFQQASGWPLDKALAESLSRVSDDLAVDLPARDDRPATQSWETSNASGSIVPLARQWTGDYSWIATVSPPTNAARDGMARNPESFEYDVSVVVFYKRPLPLTVPTSFTDTVNASADERVVGAKIMSTGPNGGELLLTDLVNDAGVSDVTDANGKNVSPFDGLKVGQWIMLCGPHPNSSKSEPRFVLKWYQVLSIEGANTKLNSYGTADPPASSTEPDHRVVAVRGPEWPWQPGTDLSYSGPTAPLSNDLCVGIVKGAIAVHTKTLRLESFRTGGMTVIAPSSVKPQVYGPG